MGGRIGRLRPSGLAKLGGSFVHAFFSEVEGSDRSRPRPSRCGRTDGRTGPEPFLLNSPEGARKGSDLARLPLLCWTYMGRWGRTRARFLPSARGGNQRSVMGVGKRGGDKKKGKKERRLGGLWGLVMGAVGESLADSLRRSAKRP